MSVRRRYGIHAGKKQLPEKITPLSHKQLIRKLLDIGFDGPFPGGKHLCMVKGKHKIIIPNPHRGDIGVVLIKKIVNQIGITIDEWNKL